MRRGTDFGRFGQAVKRLGVSALVVTMLVPALGACAPVVRVHGYLPKAEDVQALKEGEMSQVEVAQRLGSPSTTATFDDEVWYYINSIHNTYAWKKPVVVSRQIVAVRFDPETKLIAGVDRYSVEDGRIIAFNPDKTPTKGRELTFLEQLLGNVGRISTDTIDDKANQ